MKKIRKFYIGNLSLKYMQKKGEKIFSIALTSLVLGLLLLSGPANAFILELEIDNETPKKGEKISFEASITIEAGERLPVEYLTLKLIGPQDVTCKFYPNATLISGCNNLTITRIKEAVYDEGNLSGKYKGKDYNWGYGYGYGYSGEIELSYNVELDTSNMKYGDYKTEFTARIDGKSFTQKGNAISIIRNITELKVYSPLAGIYNTKTIPFNISVGGEAERIEYKDLESGNTRFRLLCRDCTDYGFDRRRTKTLKEGENNLIFRAEAFNAVYEKNVLVFIDSTEPRIARITPSRNSIVNGSEFSVKYTEENIKNTTLFFGNSSKQVNCPSGKNQLCTTSLDLSSYDNEDIYFWFEIEDIAGNKDIKKPARITVDTIKPEINNINLDLLNSRHARIFLNISEKNFDIAEYKDNNKPNSEWITFCSNLRNNECDKRIRFYGSSPDISLRIFDKAGNSAEAEIVI